MFIRSSEVRGSQRLYAVRLELAVNECFYIAKDSKTEAVDTGVAISLASLLLGTTAPSCCSMSEALRSSEQRPLRTRF